MWYTNITMSSYQHEPVFGPAISEAIKVIRKEPGLALFGLLSVVVGQFGLADFLGKLAFGVTDTSSLFRIPWPQTLLSWVQLTWFLVLVIIVGSAIVLVAVAAEGALIAGAAYWYRFRKVGLLQRFWHTGVKHFWRLLAVHILEKILLIFILFVARFSFLYSSFIPTQWGRVVGSVVLTALIILFGLVVTSVAVFARGYIVVEEMTLQRGVVEGLRLFSGHGILSLELNFCLLILSTLYVLVFGFISTYLFIPSVFLLILAGFFNSPFLSVVAYYGGWLFVGLILMAAAAFLNAATTAIWIMVFMRIRHVGASSRLWAYLTHWFRR